jgi:AcrR family transcriptional regulator
LLAEAGPKTGSLRDARKRRTKRALRDAALKLFATKGYDTTTTEEIAERAGVSARTFFRYFPTKEAVVFEGEGPWFESFAEAYCAQPPEMNDIDAICATLIQLSPSMEGRRSALRLYERSMASSATLRGLKQDNLDRNIVALADAIASRRGLSEADEACTLMAGVVALVHRRSVDCWVAAPADTDITKVIKDEFAILNAAFAGAKT